MKVDKLNVVRLKLFIFYCLLLSTFIPLCYPQTIAVKLGQVQLIGIFPNTFHQQNGTRNSSCSNFILENIKLTQAMIYAIDNLINNNPNLLPNIQVGWILLDSCSSSKATVASLSTILSYQQRKVLGRIRLFPNQADKTILNTTDYTYNPMNDNNNSFVFGVVGGKLRHVTNKTAAYTSSNRYSQISYNYLNRSLIHQPANNYFYDSSLPKNLYWDAILNIITYFNWNWITFIIADQSLYQEIIQDIHRLPERHEICFDQVYTINNNSTKTYLADMVVQLKSQSKSQVIVILGHHMQVYQFFKQAERYQLTGKTWISSSHHWLTTEQINSIDAKVLEGAIILTYNSTPMQAFQDYLNQLDFCNNMDNKWFIEAWHQQIMTQGLDWDEIRNNCTIAHHLKMKYFSRYYDITPLSAYVIDATLAFAYTLHGYLGCNLTSCPSIDDKSFNNPQFNDHLRQIQFDGVSSQSFQFAADGTRQGSFDIVNLQLLTNASTISVHPVKVGAWHQIEGLVIEDDQIIWNTKQNRNNSKPKSRCSEDCSPGFYVFRDDAIPYQYRPCCWSCSICKNGSISNTTNQQSCVDCPILAVPNQNRTECIDLPKLQLPLDGLVAILLYILISIYTLALIFTWVVFIMNRHTPVIKGSNFTMINLLLAFSAFAIPASILSILPLTPPICLSRIYFETLMSVGVYMTILCKTNQISMIFKNVSRITKGKRRLTKTLWQVIFIFIVLFASNGVLTLILVYMPLPMIQYRHDNYIVVICGDQYFYSHINLLAWMFVIAMICLRLAYKTRLVPNNFRESKHIFISTIIITIIAISTIIIDFFTSGHLTTILNVISAIAFGATPLISLFFPKLYIIIFRSHQNTKEHAMADISHFTFKKVNKRDDSKFPDSSIAVSIQKVSNPPHHRNQVTPSLNC